MQPKNTNIASIIDEIMPKGVHVFGEKQKFFGWFHHPNQAFKNRAPIDVLQSERDIQIIIDQLGRIEHGVFS